MIIDHSQETHKYLQKVKYKIALNNTQTTNLQ